MTAVAFAGKVRETIAERAQRWAPLFGVGDVCFGVRKVEVCFAGGSIDGVLFAGVAQLVER